MKENMKNFVDIFNTIKNVGYKLADIQGNPFSFDGFEYIIKTVKI